MRILFTSIRNAGHFNPLVPFIDACRKRGHEVGVAAAVDLEAAVVKTGATFFVVDHPGDQVLGPIWAQLPKMTQREAQRTVIGEIFARLNGGAALPKMLAAIERWKPAIVVREATEFGGAVAAEARGIPHVRVGITMSSLEAEARAMAADAVADLRGRVGLPIDPHGEALSRAPYLTLFPASFDPNPIAQRFHVPAPTAPAAPLPHSLPEAWWPGQKGPLVYLTFGSVAGGMAVVRSAYPTAIAAMGGLDARVLLTTGMGADLETLGPIPPNVHVERWVPQADVLAHAAAVVCHGGSGTTMGTLAAGIPLVVVPLFADQPDNARRVAELGAGLNVERDTNAIRLATTRVLAEPSFRHRARALAEEMAALPPIDRAVDALEKAALK